MTPEQIKARTFQRADAFDRLACELVAEAARAQYAGNWEYASRCEQEAFDLSGVAASMREAAAL